MADTAEQGECNYAPDPKYTFCFAPSHDLSCVICKDSKLTLPRNAEGSKDTNPYLLPCGHVFGEKCLKLWLRAHETCPVCRFRMRYELCRHPVPPRRLTKENLLFVPQTISDGGALAAQCYRCSRETDHRVAAELWTPLAKSYYESKLAYERIGSEADKQAMEQRKGDLDKVMEMLTPPEDQQW